MSPDEIDQRFGFHPARQGTDESIACAELRAEFVEFTQRINHRIPGGREKALAMTALQEAAMWSQTALAMTRPLEEE